MKVWVYTHDPILTLCYSPTEAADMFGKDALDEDGTEVPDELAEDIISTYKKLCELSRRLEEILQK